VGTWYGNQLKGLARAAAPDDIRALAARIQDHLSRPVSAGLREHQREALSAIARRLGTTGASPTSITVIPTAGGKTRIFLHLVAAANLNASVPHRTIMLVPTRELIGQTWREMREHFPGLDLGYVASEEILDAAGDRVPRRVAATTLMTYQRFMRLAEAGKLSPDDVDLVVMYEAHRALSDLRQDVIAEFKDRVVMAAFSATPAFDDEKSLHSLLGAENQTLMVTPKRLRDAGVIAPVVNLVMGVSLKGRLPRDARESTLVRRKALVDAALDLVETHVDDELGIALKDKVALFYGTDIAHARMFVEEYNARFGGAGRGAVLVTGADGPEHLRGAVEGVRRGTVGAFGNAQMLVEGFDLPEIGLAINAPTQSLVKQLQQSGRAQRIDPALPADDVRQTAYVLDSYFRINGRIVGSPRFYFDAVDDVSTARMIELPARDVGAVDVGGYLDLPGFDPTNGCADGKEAPDPAGADAVLTGAGDALPGPLGPDATAGGAAPGASGGEPPRRRRAVRPVQEGLDIAGHMEAVHRFVREREREAPPRKTDGWLTLVEVAVLARVSPQRPDFRAAWDAASEDVRAGRDVALGGGRLRFAERMAGFVARVCLHVEDFAAFCEAASLPAPSMAEVGPDDMTRERLCVAIGVGPSEPSFVAAFDLVRDALASAQGTRLGAMGIEAGWRRNGKSIVAVVSPGSVHAMARLMGLKGVKPLKGDEWLFGRDVQILLGASSKNGRLAQVWAGLSKAYEDDRLEADYPGVRFSMVRSGAVSNYAIHRDSVAWLAPQIGRPERGRRAITAEWLPMKDLIKRIPGPRDRDERIRVVIAEIGRQLSEGEEASLGGRPIRAEYRTNVSKTVVCVHETEVDRIAGAIGLAARFATPVKTDEWMSKSQVAIDGGLTNYDDLAERWARMADEFKETGKARLAGREVKVAFLRSGPHSAYYLHRDHLNLMRESYGLAPLRMDVPEHGPDDLTIGKTAKALGVSVMGGNFRGIWALLAKGSEGGTSTVDGATVRFRERRRGTVVEHVFHRGDLAWYAEALTRGLGFATPPKSAEWLTSEEAADRIGASSANRHYVALWAGTVAKAEAGTLSAVRMEKRRSGSSEVWCLHAGSAEAFAGLLPESAILRRPATDAAADDAGERAPSAHM
jgi:superfamily II DNA or RNA helicase